MLDIKIGQYVKYESKEYVCKRILVDPETFRERIILVNDDIVLTIDSDNIDNIIPLNKFNDDIIKINDKVLYDNDEYFVCAVFDDPNNLNKQLYGLKNILTGNYVSTGSIDNTQIQKIKE